MTTLNRNCRIASRKPARTILRIERLENRLALSGFGPEDGAYILESRGGSYESVKVIGDDQIVAAGGGTVARYDSFGNVDAAFGNSGIANTGVNTGTYGAGAPLSIQSDGKLVMGGRANGGTATGGLAAARLNGNGTPDTTFGSAGVSGVIDSDKTTAIETANASAIQSNGKIVVAGRSGNNAVIARFNASGAVDDGKGGFGQTVKGKPAGYTVSSFGTKYNQFWGLSVQSDDKIVAVGNLDTTGNGDNRLIVARYTASGVLDTSFNGTGYALFLPAGFSHTEGAAVTTQIDGKIVVAGYCSGVDGWSDMLVARFNANGSVDASFGGGDGYVRLDIDGANSATSEHAYGIAIQPDGKIVVSGWEAVAVSGSDFNVLVARLNVDGTLDGGFGNGGLKTGAVPWGTRFEGTGVALQSSGSIIVVGHDNPLSGNADPHPFLMRFYGDNAPLSAAAEADANSGTTSDSAVGAALLFWLTEDLHISKRRA